MSIPIRCWSVFCFRFPTNRILFYVGSRMGVGVGAEASSHVAQSVVYVICWLQLCIGFPANRILFCVGSGRVCSVGGALENAVLSLEIAAGACWALENAVPSLEIAARACSEPHVRSKSQLGPVPEPTHLKCRAS